MKPMRIVVTGPEGQIGWELLRVLPSAYQVIGVGRSQMDLTEPAAIARRLRDLAPDLIINAAGYTAVDRAEDEPDIAEAVNATAVGVIGEEARRIGAAVIHFSTDYVFDGAKGQPYTPFDEPNPLSVYGRTKLAGERSLLESGAAAIILRTSWVYGLRGHNFLRSILRQAGEKPELRIVEDQIGSPTWCHAIAVATAKIIARSACGAPGGRNWSFSRREGIYHLSAHGQTSWFDFAQMALELGAPQLHPRLIRITTEMFAAKAARPKFSVLDCATTEKTFDLPMDEWQTSLQNCLRGGVPLDASKAGMTGTFDPTPASTSSRERQHESVQPIAQASESGPEHRRRNHGVGSDRPGNRPTG